MSYIGVHNHTDIGSNHEFRDSINKIHEWIKRFRKIDPIQSPVLINGESTIDNLLATQLVDRISECAKNRSQLNAIYTGTSYTKMVQEIIIEVH